MGQFQFIPEYLIREQAAVGALVIFGLLRVIVAAVALERNWSISLVQKSFIAVAFLYCLPQLVEYGSSLTACAELEGKVVGCAIALFCAPILSHRLGYE
jgi:hypothetical protein